MRLAAVSDRIHAAGGEVIAVSVDDERRQAGMFERWPTPHTTYVSDPGGERILQPLGLFDPEERGGIALPGLLVIAPDGSEAYRYQGRDFADRTTDEPTLEALEGLGLPSIDAPDGGPTGGVDGELDRFFAPATLGAYFRGNKFGALAIQGRLDDPEAQRIAREHRMMADATLEAWSAVR